MVALVHTKLVGTVQTTVVEHVIRPYFFCTWDQNGTLNQKYTGTIPLRYVSYHKMRWYERTTYQIGTAPYHNGTLGQKYDGTAYCCGTLRTVKHSQTPETSTQRTVVVRIVLFHILRRLTRQHSVPFRYESYCFGTAHRTMTVRRTGYGTPVPLIFY